MALWGRPPTDPVIRFVRHLAPESGLFGCWFWAGGVHHSGTPIFAPGGRNEQVRADVWAYEQAKGRPVAKTHRLVSGCREDLCVRPDHHAEVARR